LFFTSSAQPWQDWELSAIMFTLFYTAYVYGNGFLQKYYDDIGGQRSALLIISGVMLFIASLLAVNDHLGWFNWYPKVRGLLVLLAITASLFAYVDFNFGYFLQPKHPKVSAAYFASLVFSDIPTAIAFTILAGYAFGLGPDKIKKENMDAFFGGAIAFQMIVSNLIWTLTDDAFVKGEKAASEPLSPLPQPHTQP